MALDELTRSAVLAAIKECDELGRDRFLEVYGFRRARAYFLVHEGNRYDSKAIAGVAHRFISRDARPLRSSEFNGGEMPVQQVLERLGFEIAIAEPDGPEAEATTERSPPWSRDELILALDLYLKNPRSPPGKASPAVGELSETLNRIASRLGRSVTDTYRNANGVYMKMMNFRRFDAEFSENGRVGLTRGNKDEQVVWDEYADKPDKLREVVAAIRDALKSDDIWGDQHDDELIAEAPEGRLLTRLHVTRERSQKLVAAKKKSELAKTGRLACEVCGFDFATRYGSIGDGFIEVHHIKPVHTLTEDAKTRLEDLSLVCSNCHRMIHAASPWLELKQLKAKLRSQ